MKLVVLNKVESDKIKGIYKKNHLCEPLIIGDDKYVINSDMFDLKEIKGKIRINKSRFFTIGSKTPSDLVYRKYLILKRGKNS